MRKTLQPDLCSGPFLKKIIRYTVPIILTGMLQQLFNAVDLMVVGQFRGNNAVSAVGATTALVTLMTCLFVGLSTGAGVCVAQGIGARNRERVHRAVHTAIPVGIIGGALLTVVGIVLAPVLLRFMGTPENVVGLSSVYLRIYFAGGIPMLMFHFGAAILRGAGDTKSPLLYLSFAGVLNVLLNLFFVVVLKRSADGVAWATTISQTVACILVLRKLSRREDGCRLELKKLKISGSMLCKIVWIGLPAGIQTMLLSISNVLIQSSVNTFGETVLSGNSAAIDLETFVYVAVIAFQQTSMTFVGQNVGAGKYKNVGKVVWLNIACTTVVGIVLGGLFVLFAEQLLPLYLKEGGAAIQHGINRMQIICLFYFLCGVVDVLSGGLRGMGASTLPMAVCVLGICGLRILWIFTVFQRVHTPSWLYLSYPISWVITGATLLVCFTVLLRKRKKQMAVLEQGC